MDDPVRQRDHRQLEPARRRPGVAPDPVADPGRSAWRSSSSTTARPTGLPRSWSATTRSGSSRSPRMSGRRPPGTPPSRRPGAATSSSSTATRRSPAGRSAGSSTGWIGTPRSASSAAGSSIIDDPGDRPVDLRRGREDPLSPGVRDLFLLGGRALVRAEAIARAGRFWDDLFIYNEETDLSITDPPARAIGSSIPRRPRSTTSASEGGRVLPARYWFYQIEKSDLDLLPLLPVPVALEESRRSTWWSISIKSAANFDIAARACPGSPRGSAGTGSSRDFRDKLTAEECRRIESLNRRCSLRLGR